MRAKNTRIKSIRNINTQAKNTQPTDVHADSAQYNSAPYNIAQDKVIHNKKLQDHSDNPPHHNSTQRNIMFVGTGSGVGKTLITVAFCRYLSNKGCSVAPFKSQNMSSNSFTLPREMDSTLVADSLNRPYADDENCETNGAPSLAKMDTMNSEEDSYAPAEISKSQYIQAKAARATPDARMNPILLKPMGDSRSKLILMGREVGEFSAKEYYKMKTECFEVAKNAFNSLSKSYNTIVLEGAGSPAEINLQADDIVNMRMAHYAKADTFLVADISAGGVFASIKGTIDLIEERYKYLIKGIIINKFRGDKDILLPGIRQIEEITNIPVLGVLPYHYHGIEEEDSHSSATDSQVSEYKAATNTEINGKSINVVVLDYPRALSEPVVNVLQKYRNINIRPLSIHINSAQSGGISWGVLGADFVIVPHCSIYDQAYALLRSQQVVNQLRKINAPIVAIGASGKLFTAIKIKCDTLIDDANDLANPETMQKILKDLNIQYTVQDDPTNALDKEYDKLAKLIEENLDLSTIFL